MFRIKTCIFLFIAMFSSLFAVDFPLEYRCAMSNTTSNQIQGELKITNNSGSSINLSELTAQYYYTKEGTASENGFVDYGAIEGSTYRQVAQYGTITFNSDHFEVGFTSAAGTLAAGDRLIVQYRVSKSDWSNYDQSNDASFDASYTALAPYTAITVNGGGVVTVTTTVTGYAKDVTSGAAIANASVKVGSVSATTNSQGYFSLVAEVADNSIIVEISKSGYADYNKPFGQISVDALEINAVLLAVDKVVTISPSNSGGNSITTTDGATVSFPQMNSIGENLVVAVTSYDVSTAEADAAPGDYSAINSEGEERVLISQGMLDVNITGASTGNEYSLQGHGPFQITIPISGDPALASETIDLWHYDVASGKWIEEGYAVKVGNAYQGTVTHFSTWNSDIEKKDNLCISGDIIDTQYGQTGDRYTIRLSAWGYNRTYTQYNPDLNFQVYNLPQDADITISVVNNRTGASAESTFHSGTTNYTCADPFDAGDYVLEPITVDLPVNQDAWVSDYNNADISTNKPFRDERDNNYGASPSIVAEAWSANGPHDINLGIRRTFIDFDLTTIPSDAQILSATLTLKNADNRVNGSGSNATFIQLVNSAWQENVITWNNQVTTTTVDRISVANFGNTDDDYIVDMTDFAQDWHTNPANNFGFMIRLQSETIWAWIRYASSEHADSSLRPVLAVTYINQ